MTTLSHTPQIEDPVLHVRTTPEQRKAAAAYIRRRRQDAAELLAVLGLDGAVCECGKAVPFDGGAEGVCECCSTCVRTGETP